MTEPRFSLKELVEASEMPERTIRYYIEKGLISRARGKGRSAYYTAEHLRQIERIRAFQGHGLSLDEIKVELRSGEREVSNVEVWHHLALHPDLEIQVRRDAPEAVHILVRRFQEVAREWFGAERAQE